ncbi:MAG: nicotinamidase [Gammaproteobacteria bacterium]
MRNKLQKGDVLLVVDPQIDFFPNGALGVAEGDQILPVINHWIAAAEKAEIPIVISRDWHPANHISFHQQGGPWPSHCVRDTQGAAFHPDLKLPKNAIIVDKAIEPNREAYSAFAGVTHVGGVMLNEELQTLGITRLWIGGLALDYCVFHTALDARKLNLDVHVILPACRAISDKTGQEALQKMRHDGVVIELDTSPYEK